MPKRTDAAVRLAVFTESINNPGDGAPTIHKRIEAMFGKYVVSPRTVGSLVQQARSMTPAEKRSYTDAVWPEAFGTADLPWESAAAVRELSDVLGGRTPLIPLAKWYWRATLVAPGDTPEERHLRAMALAMKYDYGDGRVPLGSLLIGRRHWSEPGDEMSTNTALRSANDRAIELLRSMGLAPGEDSDGNEA